MPQPKVKEFYRQTLSLSDGLREDLAKTQDHNRFKIPQKHIRFHILDVLVKKYASSRLDLKHFILHHHHAGEELSQRDIMRRLKDKLNELSEDEKIELIKEAINKIANVLKKITVEQYRDKYALVFDDKMKILDRAAGDDCEEMFLGRLDSFDQKTIANFVATFNLPMRRKNEKSNGKTCKRKLAKHRRHQNGKMWADPEKREAMCKAMKESWKKRKNRTNGKAEKPTEEIFEESPEISGEKLLGKILEYMKSVQPRSWHDFEKPIKNLFQEIAKTNGREVTLGDLCNYFANGEGQAFWEKGKEPKFILPIKGYLYKEGLISKDELSNYGLAYNQID